MKDSTKDKRALAKLWFVTRLVEMRDKLRKITDTCRPDMHEPDEQDVTVVIHGNHLDNAMGDIPEGMDGEFVIEIIRPKVGVDEIGLEDHNNYDREYFNLASLLALAKTANPGTLMEK